MYAELVMINLGSGMRSTAKNIVDQLTPIYRTMKGSKVWCSSVTVRPVIMVL